MTRQEHLLTIAGEECAEIAQRISKALRFGLDQVQAAAGHAVSGEVEESLRNGERIVYELDHLLTVLDMAGVIQIDHEGCLQVDAVRQGEKARKVEHFLKYSAEQGTLRPEGPP